MRNVPRYDPDSHWSSQYDWYWDKLFYHGGVICGDKYLSKLALRLADAVTAAKREELKHAVELSKAEQRIEELTERIRELETIRETECFLL